MKAGCELLVISTQSLASESARRLSHVLLIQVKSNTQLYVLLFQSKIKVRTQGEVFGIHQGVGLGLKGGFGGWGGGRSGSYDDPFCFTPQFLTLMRVSMGKAN